MGWCTDSITDRAIPEICRRDLTLYANGKQIQEPTVKHYLQKAEGAGSSGICNTEPEEQDG
ncbi:MAG: hypothetical protein ACLTAF_02565 [Blautia coccoides]